MLHDDDSYSFLYLFNIEQICGGSPRMSDSESITESYSYSYR